jgi:hypothetical protein
MKELNKALREVGCLAKWFPIGSDPCIKDMSAIIIVGAGGAVTPGRVREPEGANHIVISCKTTTGVITSVAIHMYKIVCYADPASGRL